jgi:hypothetical protein
MNKKYYKEEIGQGSDFKKLLKHDFIEELKWYEEELNELYLYKNKYSRKDINRAKLIIKKMEALDDLCIDRQLIYLVDRTIKRVRKIYPEFFDS